MLPDASERAHDLFESLWLQRELAAASLRLRAGIRQRPRAARLFAAPSGPIGDLAAYEHLAALQAHSALLTGDWLTDETVNQVAELANRFSSANGRTPRTYCWNSFFFQRLESDYRENTHSSSRWSQKARLKLTEQHFVLIPVNVRACHWALIVIDVPNAVWFLVDSIAGHSSTPDLQHFARLVAYYWLQEQPAELPSWWRRRLCFGGNLLYLHFSLQEQSAYKQYAQQENGSDCGVYMCVSIVAIAAGCLPALYQNALYRHSRLLLAQLLAAHDMQVTEHGLSLSAPPIPRCDAPSGRDSDDQSCSPSDLDLASACTSEDSGCEMISESMDLVSL